MTPIDACALAAVARLVKEVPRELLPSIPTVACWLALATALGRSAADEERRRFLHKWNNAMTCAWAGWPQ